MDQDQIMTRDILLKECFIIGLYCIIQCAAFFCDKIIFDTFQFYFFIGIVLILKKFMNTIRFYLINQIDATSYLHYLL